ncbi:hypothetical protein RHGRI_017095 [Rhododendron griersonianum]|uniref:Uncharacterized protein n=1 Tax=Rhododendron griersonianum TaxID=479676 RepID=A0AAV6JWN2_9ERIC|nr:hypothetical protein RHGRI_017095 [Rhododendron griersonianum]
MSQDGELCLPKVKDPALALFGAHSPYVKEEVLGRVKKHLKDIDGTLERDVGNSVSLSGQDGEGRAKGVQLSGKHTSKRPAKDAVEVAKPGKRKKTSKGNEESSKVVQPDVMEEVVRIPRVEVPEMETGGGLEMPSNSLEVTGTLDQNVAAHGVMDDIWGDEGVSSGRVLHPWKGSEESSKVVQPDVIEEVVRTRVGVLETAAGGGLEVPLDSLEAIDVVWSEEEEEEEMEEEEGSEDNDRDDDQRDEEEGEEETGLMGDQAGFNHVEEGDGGE